MKIFDEWVW